MNPKALSILILLGSIVLAYAPLPISKTKISILVGTELVEPITELVKNFRQENPNIEIGIETQGSQDIINNFLDKKTTPTILIPANGETLKELETRYRSQYQKSPFAEKPQALSKTIIVAIAWQERAKILFPNGKFDWQKLATAIKIRSWQKIGDRANWGSFDLVLTDPTRSNSSQLALSLWANSTTGKTGLEAILSPQWQQLSDAIGNAVYQPPRSTDILLQEFISRGANDGDVALVYESIAIHRWSNDRPYQIFYPNPTIETVAEAAIVSEEKSEIKAAQEFLAYSQQHQEILLKFGFRSPNKTIDDPTWTKNIPGVQLNPAITVERPPDAATLLEIQKTWQNR